MNSFVCESRKYFTLLLYLKEIGQFHFFLHYTHNLFDIIYYFVNSIKDFKIWLISNLKIDLNLRNSQNSHSCG